MTSLFPGMVISSFLILSRIGFFSSFGGIISSSFLISGSSLTSCRIGSSFFSSLSSTFFSFGASWTSFSLSFFDSFLCVFFFSFFSSNSPVKSFWEISALLAFWFLAFFSFFSVVVVVVAVSSGFGSVFCTSFFGGFFSSFFSFFSSFLVSLGSLSGSGGSFLSSSKKSISFSIVLVLIFESFFLPLPPLLWYLVLCSL